LISEMERPDGHKLRVETEVIDVSYGLIKTYTPGRTSYYLDGQPITPEQVEAFLNGADMVEVTAMGDDHRRFSSFDGRVTAMDQGNRITAMDLAYVTFDRRPLLGASPTELTGAHGRLSNYSDTDVWESGPDAAFWSPDMDSEWVD